MHVGIDASNIRAGGGITHLASLLQAAEPGESGIREVTVWAGRQTLDQLPDRPWLRRVHDPWLDGSLASRVWWQRRRLPTLVRRCDVLFVPGGTYRGSFRPFVTMSQNLLPFDPGEAARYGVSPTRFRLALLARSQRSTFRAAAGVIFLTHAAQRIVESEMGRIPGQTAVIPHGATEGCGRAPVPQRPLATYTTERPFRWLYLSIVNLYKHQWCVAEAVARLRETGMPVVLDLVGPAYPPALAAVRKVLDSHPGSAEYVRYHAAAAPEEIAGFYHRADGFVFASSCETFGIVLLDAMAAGLPVACSDHPVMREVLGGAGELFDPEDPASIEAALRKLMEDPSLREDSAARGFERAQEFTWERCARETFEFIARIASGRHAESSTPTMPLIQRRVS